MSEEIGGYFEFDSSKKGYEYYSKLYHLNSGRNAFLLFVRMNNIKKIYIPAFLCESILNICKKEGLDFEFYHINNSFDPILNDTPKEKELLYIVNYYGQLSNKKIWSYKRKYKNILIDNVQAFFQAPIKNIPSIYSCRKYFGVPDGGYLYCMNSSLPPIPTDDSSARMTHLYGRKHASAQEYYNDYLKNEALIDNLPLRFMSEQTKSMMKCFDNKRIIKVRNQNFKYLSKRLGKINKIRVNYNKGPFCYPFFIECGDQLRKHLISKLIYVPLLWPFVEKVGNSQEKEFAVNILPIPCDQRYSITEMSKICDIIEQYVEQLS